MNATGAVLRYPYADGDLLECRNSYFYTPFHGQALLSAWEAQREAARGRTARGGSTAPVGTVAKATDRLLDSLRTGLSEAPDRTDWTHIDRLLQRFEVTKRLHGSYDHRWRPVDPSDYTDLGRYLAFAEVLALAYGVRPHLPYLNGLLKVMDTLTALRERLGAGQEERLDRLVLREREHVGVLRRRCLGATDGA